MRSEDLGVRCYLSDQSDLSDSSDNFKCTEKLSTLNSCDKREQSNMFELQSEPTVLSRMAKNTRIMREANNFQLSTTNEESLLYKNRYLCVSMKSGLMIVDVQRAITRICYDNLLAQVEKSGGVSQKLLFPEVLELTMDDKYIFTEIELELKSVGFEFTEFGKSMYSIEGIPAMLSEGADVLKILETILSEVKVSACSVSSQLYQTIANIISQNEAGMRLKRNMTVEERNSLIGQLFASSNPNNTPDGRKIINILSDDDFAKMWN